MYKWKTIHILQHDKNCVWFFITQQVFELDNLESKFTVLQVK